jgi:hypothetical protein
VLGSERFVLGGTAFGPFAADVEGEGTNGQSNRTKAAIAERCSRDVTVQMLLVMRRDAEALACVLETKPPLKSS